MLYGRDSLVYEVVAWEPSRQALEECIEEALASYNESIENYYIAPITAPATPYRVVASSKAPAARPPAATTLSATMTTTPTKTTIERTANIEEHTKPATTPGSSKNYAVTTSIPPSPPRGLGQAERLAIVLGLHLNTGGLGEALPSGYPSPRGQSRPSRVRACFPGSGV